MPQEDDDALNKLREEVAKMRPPGESAPAHPTATEVVVEAADKVEYATHDACNHEGWRYKRAHGSQYAGLNPALPVSVFCALPKGHLGKHTSKPRFALLPRRRQRVYQWSDVDPQG
jgi:hypothetical protein